MSGPTGGRALVRRLAVGGLLAVAVTVTSCTSDPGTPGSLPSATTLDSSPASSAVTPSPSPSATSDEAAIEAAVRSYYSGMDLAVTTGDVAAFNSSTVPKCQCRAFSAAVTDRFANGELIGAGVEVVELAVTKTAENRAVATVVYDTAAYTANSDSGESKSFDASRVTSALVLISVDGNWLVNDENVVERA